MGHHSGLWLYASMSCCLSGVCIPLGFCCVHSCTSTSACFEPALATLCGQRSSVVHMRVDPSSVCCSAFLAASTVSGLLPPTLSCFHCIYYISATGAPPSAWGSCLGFRICQPWEQSHLGAGCKQWNLLNVWALNLHLAMPLLMEQKHYMAE